MENIPVLNNGYNSAETVTEVTSNKDKVSGKSNSINHAAQNLIAMVGTDLYQYLKSNSFPEESDFIVISPTKHYYYDENDLKNIRSLVNLNKLNNIKHLDKFLHILFRVLPAGANFIGCFSDSKKLNGSNKYPFYQPSVLLNKFKNFLDSRTDHYINRDEVFGLLKLNGFKVLNMTEINGITYFYSQMVAERVELRA